MWREKQFIEYIEQFFKSCLKQKCYLFVFILGGDSIIIIGNETLKAIILIVLVFFSTLMLSFIIDKNVFWENLPQFFFK